MSSQVAAKTVDVGVEAPSVGTAKKDLYEIGEIPPLGHVPKNMYAWAIRRDRQGRRRAPCRSRWCRRGSSTATTCSSS